MKKLNIGCGRDIKAGYINIDIAPLDGVDIVSNISKEKLPFQDNDVDEVVCIDILEHVDLIFAMREIHRVLKPNGKLSLRVPHFTSANNYIDPTHVRMFSARTFKFFTKKSLHDRDYYFDFAFSSIQELKITFQRRYFFISWLANRSDKFNAVYEDSPLRIFPAGNLEVVLIK